MLLSSRVEGRTQLINLTKLGASDSNRLILPAIITKTPGLNANEF